MPKTTKTTKGKLAARPRVHLEAKPPRVPRRLPPKQVPVMPALPLYEIPPDEKEVEWLAHVGASMVRDAEEILFEEPYIPFLRSDLQSWQARSAALAQKVCDGDENALFALIKHDPRYLLSPAIVVKLMCWRVQIHRDRTAVADISKLSSPSEEPDPGCEDEEPPPQAVRAGSSALMPGHANATAQAKLRRLAEAVRFTIGKGHHHGINRAALLSEYREALRHVEDAAKELRALRGPLSAAQKAELARRHHMRLLDVETLLRSPRKHEALAQGIVAHLFGIGTEQIRRRLREAEQARVIPPMPDE